MFIYKSNFNILQWQFLTLVVDLTNHQSLPLIQSPFKSQTVLSENEKKIINYHHAMHQD